MNDTKVSDIKHESHTLDADGQILGRLATKIASLLVGKSKSYFVRHLDCGDFVIINNAAKVKVTGKKETDKLYTHYSGYPGGLKTKTLRMIRKEKPTAIIHHAVSGMLPNNKLKKFWMERLTIKA
ncbi:MAG: 50S ribosomal protein L13 [Patescibacteria group bacterium]